MFNKFLVYYHNFVFISLKPYAWEAREYLRKRLIGLEVTFTVEYTVPGTNREYGCIYIGSGECAVVFFLREMKMQLSNLSYFILNF